jgi:hypothetical protein
MPLVRLLPAALLAATGCSALLSKPLPPDYGSSQQPRCTRGRTLAFIDTAVAALAGGAMLAPDFVEENLLGRGPDEKSVEIRRRALLPAAVFAASAIYGYTVVSRCRNAHERHAEFEPFPVFAQRTFTESRCQLQAQSFPDHGEIAGTVVMGLDTTTLKATFHGKGDSWACDPLQSEATTSAGVKRAACLILRDDCRPRQ